MSKALPAKGQGNIMLALFILKPTETANYDACTMRRTRQNILQREEQWEEKNKEYTKRPTGDCSD